MCATMIWSICAKSAAELGEEGRGCPLFDAPQAVEILPGRPSSRHFQNATESGEVKPCRRHRESGAEPRSGERG